MLKIKINEYNHQHSKLTIFFQDDTLRVKYIFCVMKLKISSLGLRKKFQRQEIMFVMGFCLINFSRNKRKLSNSIEIDVFVYCDVLTKTVSWRYPLLCNSITKVSVSFTSCLSAVNDMKHQVRWKGWFGKTFPPETRHSKHIDISFVSNKPIKKSKENFQYWNILALTANLCSHFWGSIKGSWFE